MNNKNRYMVSIETGFRLPTGDIDAVTFFIDDKELMNKIVDLAVEHKYAVKIENPEVLDDEE